MNKFNKLIQPNKTKVLINSQWYLVKEVHETRKWIAIDGLQGQFQRGDIEKFTNK